MENNPQKKKRTENWSNLLILAILAINLLDFSQLLFLKTGKLPAGI
jgi:hypothetical protein